MRRGHDWRRIVDEQDASGLSVSDFCDARGLATSTFYLRRQQIRAREAQPPRPRSAQRPRAFRIVLSFSRKAYSEVVWRQTTEAFLGALENAFRHFGGVPQRLVIDNLKAAVAKADWYDPEARDGRLSRKAEEFHKLGDLCFHAFATARHA